MATTDQFKTVQFQGQKAFEGFSAVLDAAKPKNSPLAVAQPSRSEASPATPLSKDAIAREFFDCGYAGCTASQKVLIDSRFADLVRHRSEAGGKP